LRTTSLYQREKSSPWSVRSSTNCLFVADSVTPTPQSAEAAFDTRVVVRVKRRSIGSARAPSQARRSRSAESRAQRRSDFVWLQLAHAAEVALRAMVASMQSARLTPLVPAQDRMAVAGGRKPQLRRGAAEQRDDGQSARRRQMHEPAVARHRRPAGAEQRRYALERLGEPLGPRVGRHALRERG